MAPRKEEAESRVLAVAIMRDGKVVGKMIPGAEPVRLGTGYNNNIVVEGAELPDSMVFIVPGEEPDTWILRLSRTMDAVIESADGATLKFADLRELGIFPVDSNGFHLLNIKYGDQGQVHAGHFLIHFGFIAPPKVEKPAPEAKAEKKDRQPPKPPVDEKPDTRVLKILVEEPSGKRELFPNAGLMTVGEADYNTVCIKGIGLPRIHTLLEPEGNRYVMRLIPGIKGGVEVKGSVIPFDTLIQRHLMTQEKPGDPHVWVFDKSVSGVFTMGGVEVFFSFAEPVVQKEKPKTEAVRKAVYVAPDYDWDNFAARPHDGVAMKGNRSEANRIAIILGLGIAVALITGAAFDRLVTVVKESKEQLLRRAPSARVATLAHQPEPTEGIGEEVITDMGSEETVEVGAGGGGGAGEAQESGGVADGQAAGQAVLQSIGFAAFGTGGTGGTAGVASDLQAAAASGVGLASGGGGEALLAGAGGGGSGGIDGLLGSGGGGLSSTIEGVSSSEVEAVHRAAEVSFSTHSSSSQIGVQGRTMNDIRQKINMINMRVKRAYEDLLRNDPTAGGTISVSFSITPDGSVVGVSVSAPGNLSSLTASVTAAVQSLNFGPSSEQTENIPMSVPMNLVPPE